MEEFVVKINHDAKLKELLRNLTSVESNICAEASKQFTKILKSESGSEFLRAYVQSSSKLVEISQAWEFWKTKPGFLHILNLISGILKHRGGKSNDNADDGGVITGVVLDKFARMLIEEKIGDLYKELNSKEGKRQNAVLLLLTSIVLRNSHLAWEVAKFFDFKLPIFPKLAEIKLRGSKAVEGIKRKHSTRKSFVGFVMAFLEVGHPRLLRGILQQKEMYSRVLRGLGNDDEETVVYVLSMLRDKVLIPESLVPTGLRSVLFGSATLEQLISISGRNDFGDAAEMAHNVLVLVCTNPENGLMPDLERNPSPLHGNPKRLMDLMKKLKATEVEYHIGLLLSIVKGNPLFGSGYLDEFPYNLEDLSSVNWWPAVSVAANVVSSVGDGLTVDFIDYREPPPFESPCMQKIVKCIVPRPFTRLIINKGLLHSEPLYKHGTLRLVLEALNLLDSLLNFVNTSANLNKQMMHKWASLKTDIVNQVRVLLPDPQVLLSLLNPINSQFKILEHPMKRKSVNEVMCNKRLKRSTTNEDIDIVVGGINSSEVDMSWEGEQISNSCDELSHGRADVVQRISSLWGLHKCTLMDVDLNDGDTYFYSKLLDTLRIYHRTMPMTLERLFDFFKFLPSNPLSLPSILQQSLLQLLNEHVHECSKDMSPVKTRPQMYKHLHSFMILFMYSPSREIKEQAYFLAKGAILSTGAFENNSGEISAWLLFIPGYCSNHVYDDCVDVEIFQNLSAVIISFLCDAVSTIGNNLYKYMEFLRHYISDAKGCKDLCKKVSPFIICVLEKCVRLLISDSGAFTLPQKSLISLYVCNTIKYLLDTQVNSGTLSFLVDSVLSEKFKIFKSEVDVLELIECPCELRPLKTLLCFSRNVLHQQCNKIYSNVEEVVQSDNSFINTLSDIKKVLRDDYDSGVVGVAVGFSFSMICTRHLELLQNFPLILSISSYLHKVPFSVLASIFFLESSYLKDVLQLWPEMFSTGLGIVIDGKEKDEMFGKVDLDSMEAASMAFAFYLKKVPFCVLFSAIIQSGSLSLLGKLALQKFLLAKLTKMPPDDLISSFCNILFWINHARSSHRVGISDELELVPEICFILAEHLLRHLFVQNPKIMTPDHVGGHLPLHYAVEVAEIIFNHPVVTELLNGDLAGDEELSGSIFEKKLEALLEMAKRGIHRMDHLVLNFLRLSNEILFSICNSHKSEQDINGSRRISVAFRVLTNRLFLMFKNEFDRCIQSMDFKPLVPQFYALHTLISFISPFELLELVNWLFSKVDYNDTNFPHSKQVSLCVGLHLAGCAFDFLSGSMWQQPYKSKVYCVLGTTDENHLNVSLFEEVFVQVFEIAHLFNIDVADICLLKAVKVVKSRKVIQNPCISAVMDLSQVMASTPVDIISHCLQSINRIKAELLFLVTELNPMNLSVFGQMFSQAIKEPPLPTANLTQEKFTSPFSDKQLIMLLPTVVLYLSSVVSKFGGQPYQPCQHISILYQHILLDGFSDWPKFVSDNIFEVKLYECKSFSMQEFLSIFSDSLLGKAVLVTRDHLTLSGDLMSSEWRLSLFNSVCPCGNGACDDLVDSEFDETRLFSLKKPFDFVNRVVAKINFCRMLLVPDYNKFQSELDSGEEKLIPLEVTFAVEDSRIRFLRMLINSWTLTVRRFPKNIDNSENIDGQNSSLFSFLEGFIMSNILDLIADWHGYLIKMDSLPLIEVLVKTFLIYRFEDYTAQKMLLALLTSLSEGNFACASLIQLLLAHSQFAEVICLPRESLGSTQLGMVFTPMQSILKSFIVPRTKLITLDCMNDVPTSQRHINRLELVKIIKVLFRISVQQTGVNSGEAIGVQSRELIYLLLSAYGATCAEVDLEIYNLILEIESNDKSSSGTIAQVDYLWGIAFVKSRKDWENDTHLVDPKNMDVFEERRKIRFRESLPVDPKMCAHTVLYFPYNRLVIGGNQHKDNFEVQHEEHSTTADKVQIYDPVFILRFSSHCLSMNYIEPTEFASLGLLAIAFVSISSLDYNLRKLGYEVLAKLKGALEKRQRKKDVSRLRLLLSYLQSGIEEPWQRIPSMVAVFMAEASLVLLDPSHGNYSTISKYLMNAPTLNMMVIPLFQIFFWSSSITFKADKLWILRLLYAGLNVEDDAQAYISNSIFENIFSFYSSPLSDRDSQELIVQIVKKAVKLHRLAWILVERCGLILWLSSIISALCCCLCNDIKKITLTQLPIILEVVNHVTLSRNIVEWLLKHALEQLSELSSHLFKLLVGGSDLIIEQSIVRNSILKTLTLVLKISQKRKIYQPHFTLTENGLFQLCEVCFRTSSNPSKVLGLEAVLMSIPVNILLMDPEKLLKFLGWLITTAVQSNSTKVLKPEDFDYHLIPVSGKKQDEDSLISKLLRWLTASVILGKISCKVNKRNPASLLERSGLQTLQCLLEFDGKGSEERVDYSREDILAGAIFWLLQLLGFSHSFLPSAVSALSLLLLSRFSESEFLVGRGISLSSLCSKIRSPAEANPSWRWSFYQPWRDLSIELNATEKLDEIHASEKLVVIFSIILRRKFSSSPTHHSTLNNLDKLYVYEWERNKFECK